MRVMTLGCGRVGSKLALMLDSEGHEVSIIDMDAGAFRRLGEHFRGRTVQGIGISADVLREAGIEGADAFMAVTNGDNSAIKASQIAKIRFRVPRVLARIYDPLRAELYRETGVETLCITAVGAGILYDHLFDRPPRLSTITGLWPKRCATCTRRICLRVSTWRPGVPTPKKSAPITSSSPAVVRSATRLDGRSLKKARRS